MYFKSSKEVQGGKKKYTKNCNSFFNPVVRVVLSYKADALIYHCMNEQKEF